MSSFKNKFLRPDEDNNFDTTQAQTQSNNAKNWRKNNDSIKSYDIDSQDLNKLGARLVKAEIIGNTKLAEEIKEKMDRVRKGEATINSDIPEDEILQRVDKTGNISYVNSVKRRKIEQAVGNMVYDERNSSFDYDKESRKFSGKRNAPKEFDMDEFFAKNAGNLSAFEGTEKLDLTKAIKDHKIATRAMQDCQMCQDKASAMSPHLTLSSGENVYLAAPAYKSLTDGHCLLLSVGHEVSSRGCEEVTFRELTEWKGKMVKFYDQCFSSGVLFIEICRHISSAPHMTVECIPIEQSLMDAAPVYFKKALIDCEGEWTQNKALVDYRGKAIRSVIPTGFPYFAVEFGTGGGFAHVIENERLFSPYFGKEVIAGIIDADLDCWYNPKIDDYVTQKTKAAELRQIYTHFETNLTE